MARICGLFGAADAEPDRAAWTVGQMLDTLPGPSAASVACGATALGSTEGGDSLAESAGYLVAIDGYVYADAIAGTPAQAEGLAARLLAAFRQLGFERALETLDGAFAIAFFDPTAERLWIARDRFGIKPMYYAATAQGLAFASQPSGLMSLVRLDFNRQFVGLFAGSHYRTIDNAPERSPFAAMAQLPAGHVGSVTRGAAVSMRRYWKLQPAELPQRNEAEFAETYRGLIFQAVRRRLSITSKSAFTLSGGLDSSTVLGTAARIVDGACDAFSSVYSDATYDERNEIADVVDAGIARWTPVEFDNEIDLFARIDHLVRIHNEPVATATWLAHEQISRVVAMAGYRSLFGGLGGDEMNAGEYEYFPFAFADLIKAGEAARLDRELDMWAHHHDHPIYRKDRAIGRRMITTLVDLECDGVCRPDHVPTMEGDNNDNPSYSAIGRLFAIGYIKGLQLAVYG